MKKNSVRLLLNWAGILMKPALILSYARMFILSKSLHCMVFLCVASLAFGETLMDGLRAYDGRWYAEAAIVWARLAKAGDIDTQTDWAGLYISALPGIALSPTKPSSLYCQAAEQNDPIAQINFGDFYARGFGVSIDLAKAAFWLGRAANKDYDWVAERLRQIEPKLTIVDRAEVARLTAKWWVMHPL